tara:strand:+ start:109456 stop:114567 length:5112 start_codon:yes stop_codon:yes gene_type:complete
VNNFQFVQTHHSYQEGFAKPSEYVKKAKEIGVKSLALVDRSSLSGVVEFYDSCKNNDIKPIIGVTTALDYVISENIQFLNNNQRTLENLNTLNFQNQEVFNIDFEKVENKKNNDLLYCFKSIINNEIETYKKSKSKTKEINFLKNINEKIFIAGGNLPSLISLENSINKDKGTKKNILSLLKNFLKDKGFNEKEIPKKVEEIEVFIKKHNLKEKNYYDFFEYNFINYEDNIVNVDEKELKTKTLNLIKNIQSLNTEVNFYDVKLIAINNKGLQNLKDLISYSYINGQKKIKTEKSQDKIKRAATSYPLLDVNVLKEKSDGILVIPTTEHNDIVCSNLNNEKNLDLIIDDLKEKFENNLMFSLNFSTTQEDGEYFLKEKLMIEKIVSKAYEKEIPVIGSNISKFPEKEQYNIFDLKSAMNTGQEQYLLNRKLQGFRGQYLLSPKEYEERFSNYPEVIENNNDITNMVTAEILLNKNFLPLAPVPDSYAEKILKERLSQEKIELKENITLEELKEKFENLIEPELEKEDSNIYHLKKIEKISQTLSDPYLKDIAWDGVLSNLKKDYPDSWESKVEEYEKRFNEEIDIICGMGFSGYFLIVYDFIKYAKENNIYVGPGRGSGAGSLVAYALNITTIDPIKYDLFFERFLNPERVSMPDFDIDFDEDREKVINYVKEKYGEVTQISTTGMFKAKSSVRHIAKALGYTTSYEDYLMEEMSDDPAFKLNDLEYADEHQNKLISEPTYKMIFEYANQIENKKSSSGVHAGGVVIAPTTISEFSPLQCNPDGSALVTQLDKDDVEKAGLVKFDFLGLSNLTTLKNCIKEIKDNYNEEVSLESLPLNDENTFKLLRTAKTQEVFQLGSDGMKQLLKDLQVKDIEEISALIALYRPGPMQSGMMDSFVKRSKGEEEVTYIHKKAENITRGTLGTVVYQEQVMKLGQEIAGYTLGGADMLRRAMGKKKPAEMEKQKLMFLNGSLKVNQKDREQELKNLYNIDVNINLSDIKELENYINEEGFLSNKEYFEKFLKDFNFSDDFIEVINTNINSEKFSVDNFIKNNKSDLYKTIFSNFNHDGNTKEEAEEKTLRTLFAAAEHMRYMNIFNVIEKFAGYGFNKAHSLSYSFVSYFTAYFKANYPKEYFAASLSSKNEVEKLQPIISDLTNNFNFELKKPSVNKSDYFYKADPEKPYIYAGMNTIKSVGKFGLLIEKERKANGDFDNLQDLMFRIIYRNHKDKIINSNGLSSGAFNGLLNSGSLDCFLLGKKDVNGKILSEENVHLYRQYLSQEYDVLKDITKTNNISDIIDSVEDKFNKGFYNTEKYFVGSNKMDIFKNLSMITASYTSDLEPLMFKETYSNFDNKKEIKNNKKKIAKKKVKKLEELFSKLGTFDIADSKIEINNEYINENYDKKELDKFFKLCSKKTYFSMTDKQKKDYDLLKTNINNMFNENAINILQDFYKKISPREDVNNIDPATILSKISFSKTHFERSYFPLCLCDMPDITKSKLNNQEKLKRIFSDFKYKYPEMLKEFKSSISRYLDTDEIDVLLKEKDYTGTYFSKHPTDINNANNDYREKHSTVFNLKDIEDIMNDESTIDKYDGKSFRTVVSIDSIRKIKTKNNTDMAIINFSDKNGSGSCIAFESFLSNAKDALNENTVAGVLLEHSVQYKEDEEGNQQRKRSLILKEMNCYNPLILKPITEDGFVRKQHKNPKIN